MVRVGLWGTFDVEHLGDALFPRLLGAELARRVPGLELVPASPLGYVGLNRFELDEPAAPLGAWSEERVAELAADLDALVIGGGEIVHGDDARLAPWYGLPAEVLVRRAPSRFFVEGLGKHEVDVPVVWWAVGVADADGADLAPALAERWRRAAAGRAAIVARDEPSRAALVAAGVGVRIDVVPDIALTAPRAFSAEASAVRIEHLRRRGVFPDGDALVVQGGAASLPHVDAIAAQVREICAGRGLTPVVVETEPVHGDGAFADAIAAALPEARRLPSDAGVEDVVAAIAWSAGAVGDSRTLAALAAAFGRGGATVDVDARASRVDVAERLGLGARPVRDPGRIAATFDASAAHGSVEAARDDLDAQLDRLAAILTSAEVRPHDPPPVVAGSTLADERKRYALASRALVARMAATQRAFALREAELRAYGDAVHRELVERDIRFTKLWRRLHEADRHYHFHIHRADEAELRIEHLEREIEFLRGQRVRPWLRRRVALFLWWLRPTPVGRALAAAGAAVTEAERDAERARREAERAGIVAAHDRDGTDGLRVVVLADRIPADEAIGARMVSALASRADAIRVTVSAPTADSGAAERLTAHGVEVLVDPDDGWLRDRPMHASVVVVLGPAAALRYGRAVRERQPQAAIVYDPTGPAPADRLAGRAAEAAIVAAAHVVLAPTRAHARFVEALAPTAHVVPAAPGTPDLHVALAEALARSGVALPDAAFA